jgi:hypothetical protein
MPGMIHFLMKGESDYMSVLPLIFPGKERCLLCTMLFLDLYLRDRRYLPTGSKPQNVILLIRQAVIPIKYQYTNNIIFKIIVNLFHFHFSSGYSGHGRGCRQWQSNNYPRQLTIKVTNFLTKNLFFASKNRAA